VATTLGCFLIEGVQQICVAGNVSPFPPTRHCHWQCHAIASLSMVTVDEGMNSSFPLTPPSRASNHVSNKNMCFAFHSYHYVLSNREWGLMGMNTLSKAKKVGKEGMCIIHIKGDRKNSS
jgi:hypothetical protein